MPDKVISSLDSQLSRWLGKKESKQDGCGFWLCKSVNDRACAGCTADVQLAPASPLSIIGCTGRKILPGS